MKALRISSLLAIGAAASLYACGNGADVSADDADIIGGYDNGSAKYAAVGTVGTKDAAGNYQYFCTATLISPTEVLTAKHCVLETDSTSPFYNQKLVNLIDIYFAIGADSTHPTKVIQAIAADVATPREGGFVGLGSDVGIYHLIEAVAATDAKPLQISTTVLKDKSATSQGDIGKRFTAMGYGLSDQLSHDGKKKIGSLDLNALSGKAFENMFGSVDNFAEYLKGIYGEQLIDDNMDIVNQWYDTSGMLVGYDAYLGNKPGNVQTCYGDSGGPLLAKENGVLKIFGTVSGGMPSENLACDFGSFYAAIGPKTLAAINKALTYKDPCRQGANVVSVKGACNGTVANRCSGHFEGERRLSTIDCADLDLACVTDSAGKATCGDAGSTPLSEPTPIAAPTGTSIKSSVTQARQNLNGKYRKMLKAKQK
jgi:hypothetical protein